MMNSKLFRLMAVVALSAGLSACSGTSTFVAKTPDGKVTDRVHVLASAATAVAPSLAIPVKVVNGKFVAFGDVQSTGSIVDQMMPVITAAGAIEAARSIRPSNNTNNNSNLNIAEGGNATANSFSYAQLTAIQKVEFDKCNPVMQHGRSYVKGCKG